MAKLTPSLLILGLALPGAALSEEAPIEEIIVTATKRETSAQDVPFSLNVQTEETIKRSGASNIEELS